MNSVESAVLDENVVQFDDPQDSNPAPLEGESPDVDLLGRYVADGDETAFGILVSRHASMVMGVCRRTLRREQDSEDAFQATFLVLARKAATVRKAASLSAWLYQTAYRIALRARARRARRKEETLGIEAMTTTDTLEKIASEHDQAILDEEFNRLPEKFRLPMFLCCVEGKSRDEAAEQLGLSENAVKGRLERGRQSLRKRLLLRGVTLGGALGGLITLQQTVHATHAVTPALIASTIEGSVQYGCGEAVGASVSQNALSLANSNLPTVTLATMNAVVLSWIAIIALGGGMLLTIGTTSPADVDAIHTRISASSVDSTWSVAAGVAHVEETRERGDELQQPLPRKKKAGSAKRKRCCKNRDKSVETASTEELTPVPDPLFTPSSAESLQETEEVERPATAIPVSVVSAMN